MKSTRISPETQVALVYLVFGILWILLSDRLLGAVISQPQALTTYQTYKGWLYVIASAVLIYGLLRWNIKQRLEVEANLAQVNQQFRLLFDTSLDAIFLTAPDGSVLAANPAACAMIGRSEAEICSVGRNGLVDLDDPRVMTAVEERARTGRFTGELNLKRKNGEIFTGDVSTAIFTDFQGKPRTSMVIRDKTTSKQAEARLLRLNRLYATLSQANQIILRAHDEATLFQQICKVVIEAGHYRLAWIGMIHPEDDTIRPAASAGDEMGYLDGMAIQYLDGEGGRGPTATAIRTRKTVVCEDIAGDPSMLRWREKSLQFGFRSSVSVPFARHGKAIGALAVYAGEEHAFEPEDEQLLCNIGENITYALEAMDIEADRRQVEQYLHESEERYRNLLLTSPVGIAVLSGGRIVFTNPAGARLLGAETPEQVIGIPIEAIVDPDTLPDSRERIRRTIAGEKGLYPVNNVYRRLDGSRMDVEVIATPLKYQGKPAVQVSVMDITAHKRAEAGLQASNELLRHATARLVELQENERYALSKELHDQVGQSLSALAINLNLIQNSLAQPDRERMSARFDSAQNLVSEVTDRIRNVMAELHPPVLDDYGLAAALRWLANRLNQQTGLKVEVIGDKIEPKLPLLHSMVLFRIAREALTNIIKYSGTSQAVVILDQTEAEVSLSISDEGAGFDPAQPLPLDKAHWGLVTMRERAEAIDGSLHIHSMPGEGATITVHIPWRHRADLGSAG